MPGLYERIRKTEETLQTGLFWCMGEHSIQETKETLRKCTPDKERKLFADLAAQLLQRIEAHEQEVTLLKQGDRVRLVFVFNAAAQKGSTGTIFCVTEDVRYVDLLLDPQDQPVPVHKVPRVLLEPVNAMPVG